MTHTQKALGGLAALAMTLGVPAALVLGTPSPAQACYFTPTRGVPLAQPSCGGGGGPTMYLTASPTTTTVGSPITLSLFEPAGTTYVDVTASSSFTISSGTCAANVCTPDTTGTVTLTGSNPAFPGTATATVTVTAAAGPDHLVVTPTSPTVAAGQPVAYTISRAEADGTIVDDVTAQATATLAGVPCAGGTCMAPVTPGTYSLSAADGSLSGTADVLVQAGPAARLVVTPAAHGTWNNDNPVSFSAEAFDAVGNDLGDVTASAAFTVSPDGSCNGSLCAPDTAGPHTVAATVVGALGSITLDASTPAPTVVPLLLDAKVGVPYTSTVLSFQDGTSFASLAPGSSPLPAGLGLAAPGVLTGTPTAAGTYSFAVIGGDANGQQQRQVTMTVAPGTVAKPQISISSTSVRAGTSGRRPVSLAVRLSHTYDKPVVVFWHTVNGTAVAGTDYIAAHGRITIPAGQLTATVSVSVIGDTATDPREKFAVVLTSPTHATLGTARGIVTIING